MNSHRVLVIGLDGATFDLIDPLIAEGKLPTLARLVRSGSRSALRSTIPHHSGPAWASFSTGMGPGRHGIYSFFQRAFDSYRYPPVNSTMVRGETLWQLVSRMGRTVGVMNVPGTFPPSSVNGFMITGMLSPGLEQAFYPADLRAQVLEHSPQYSVEVPALSDKVEYLSNVMQSAEARKKAALYLVERFPADLFVVVFTELDRLQHFFWADMDPNHPLHSPSAPADFTRAIETGYIFLDQAVKEIVKAAGEDVIVFLVSDHGFEGVCKLFFVNKWLEDHGYLVLNRRRSGSVLQHSKAALQKLGLWSWARRLGRLAPQSVQLRSENLSYALDIDWERTQAAFGPNLGININLQGREPKGIVSPGQEYERLCNALQAQLESYVDPETGDHVVRKVLRREEVYRGDAVGSAPDLRLVMAESPSCCGRYAYSPKVDASQPLGYSDKVFGNHAEYGIFLACGPGVRAGLQLGDVRIIDVAPTILRAMGLPIPEAMDGRPLSELFDAVSRRDGKETSSSEEPEPATPDVVFSGKDEEQIIERLRSLGYLD